MIRYALYISLAVLLLLSCKDTPKTTDVKATSSDSLFAELDTFHMGGLVFYIEPASASEFNKFKPTAFDTSESNNLKHDSTLVKRKGDSLCLKLDNGKYVYMINKITDGDDFAQYQYWGMVQDADCYLIAAGYYESYDYVLVQKSSGTKLFIPGPPAVSPGKKYLLSANADMEALFTMNGFQLYALSSRNVKLLGSRELNTWGPSGVVWETDSSVLVERLLPVVTKNGESVEPKDYIRLKLRMSAPVN